jgi:hypothetical protein
MFFAFPSTNIAEGALLDLLFPLPTSPKAHFWILGSSQRSISPFYSVFPVPKIKIWKNPGR